MVPLSGVERVQLLLWVIKSLDYYYSFYFESRKNIRCRGTFHIVLGGNNIFLCKILEWVLTTFTLINHNASYFDVI